MNSLISLPALITRAGERAQTCFLEFFTAQIRNPNARRGYAPATRQFVNRSQVRRARANSVHVESEVDLFLFV
jgi:hypothetical protein